MFKQDNVTIEQTKTLARYDLIKIKMAISKKSGLSRKKIF